MSKRNTVSVVVLSAFALTTLCLFAAVITAQKGPESTASSVKPVRGIDVIVQKNPGNTASRTVITDSSGHFSLGVLEPGRYSLRLRGQVSQAAMPGGMERNLSTADLSNCLLTIEGAQDGPTEFGWDFKANKTIPATPPPATPPADRVVPGQDEVFFRSDGVHPVSGTLRTCGVNIQRPCTLKENIPNNERGVGKSRSNIKNNAREAAPSPTPR